jgi:hypothetical protein
MENYYTEKGLKVGTIHMSGERRINHCVCDKVKWVGVKNDFLCGPVFENSIKGILRLFGLKWNPLLGSNKIALHGSQEELKKKKISQFELELLKIV